jgi:aminotransferase EvaB
MNIRVPVNDLSRGIAADREAIDAALSGVLDSGWFVHGSNHAAFEVEMANYLETTAVVGVANGTDALTVALRAVGVEAGDHVCMVANAGFYAASACLQIGAIPVYVDVDSTTLLMAVDALNVALERNPSAVIATHLYGGMAEVERISEICARQGIPVIEDCAQAVGARSLSGRAAGTIGTVGTFSFYPTKNLSALGDGGAIATADECLAQRCRELRQYGWTTRYAVERVGMNSRLDELQAAVLRTRLPRLDGRNERRRSICREYASAVADHPSIDAVFRNSPEHVGHLAVMRTSERDRLRAHLAEAGIDTDIHYPIPDDQQLIWRETGLPMIAGPLPNTHTATAEILTVPCFPEILDIEVERVANALSSFN